MGHKWLPSHTVESANNSNIFLFLKWEKKEMFDFIIVNCTNIILLIAIALITLDTFIAIAVNLPAFSCSIPEFQRKPSAQS